MKLALIFIIPVFLLGSCKNEDPVTPCIQERIDEFKMNPGAERIVRIERPGDPLFWFVDAVADGWEDVVSEDCAFTCVTDFYGITEQDCDPAIFDFPQEVIWEK